MDKMIVRKSKNKLKAVLFDLDDTLFDRDKSQIEIIRTIVNKYKDLFKGIEEEKIIKTFLESDRIATKEFEDGGNIDEVRVMRSERFFEMLGLSTELANEMTTIYLNLYPTLNIPVENAELVLKNLEEKFQLGIVSNGSLEIQNSKLETLNIKHYFECIILSEEVGFRKPDPRIFWVATNSLSVDSNECLYIGDLIEVDVLGAKNAGMLSCWFNRREAQIAESNVRPDYEIKNLRELLDILGKS